jgi:hypothetical protein
MYFIPVMIVVFIPAIAFAYYIGAIGFVAGLGVSAIIGGMSGIIPTYGVFLLILICVIAFVYFMRQGGILSGGNGGTEPP